MTPVSFCLALCAPQLTHFWFGSCYCSFTKSGHWVYCTTFLMLIWWTVSYMVYIQNDSSRPSPHPIKRADNCCESAWIWLCETHILYHIIMKSIQASLLLREDLEDRFCIIWLKREQPNHCWKALLSLKTLIAILAKKKKNSPKKVIQEQWNQQNPTRKVVYQRKYT